MPKFVVRDALGRVQHVEASSLDAVTAHIVRSGERNVYGVERESGKGTARFYLDRGAGTLWRISVDAASVELAMGGFEK